MQALTFISRLLKSISLFGVAIVLLAFCYVMFVGDAIGEDIVVQTGEYFWPSFFSILDSVIWTYFIWYSCRLLSYAQENVPCNPISEGLLRHMPRLIAYNAIVMMQLAILHLQTICDIHGGYLFLFWIAMNVYYIILNNGFSISSRKNVWFVSAIILAGAYICFLLCILFFKLRNNANLRGHEFWLPIEAIYFFFVQVFSMWFFIQRKRKMKINGGNEKVGLLNIPAFEDVYFKVFCLISLFATIIYLSVIFCLHFSRIVGAFGFALIGISVLIGFFSFLHFFSIRKNINIFFFLLLLAICIGIWGKNPYRAKLNYNANTNLYKERPTVGSFFMTWATKRKDMISKSLDSSFVVYFILSDGGASRSAYWASTVLSKLEDSSVIYFNHSDSLSNHIFCLAGASGGNVGNATFYSLLLQKKAGLIKNNLNNGADKFLRSDFLTYSLGRYLGPDMFRHIFPWVPVDDRAAALEYGMEHGEYGTIVSDVFSKPLSKVFDNSGDVPALFMNTTRVQDGRPGIVSSLKMDTHSWRIDVLDTVGAMNSEMNLSTGAVLGSRFPYLSPAGGIGNNFFVDGGYYDNSGAGTVLEVYQNIQKWIAIMPDTAFASLLKRKLRFKIIHLENSSLNSTSIKAVHPLVNDLAAPILTIFQTGNSVTGSYLLLLENELTKQKGGDANIIPISLYREKDSANYAMDWVISNYQLERMSNRMESEVKKKFAQTIIELK